MVLDKNIDQITGWPDELQVLLKLHPRESWHAFVITLHGLRARKSGQAHCSQLGRQFMGKIWNGRAYLLWGAQYV